MALDKTKQIANISTCAALYAVAIAATAFVPTPWGVGQFRPGVVVPAIYAFIGGPLVAALGAAIGTFIGSFILQAAGTGLGPIGSIFTGSPANFIGFLLFGWFVNRYKSWYGFILGSFVSLLIGNFVAAGTVVLYLTYIFPVARWVSMLLDLKVAAVVGLTLFWTVTMLPFVLIFVPLVVVAVSRGNLLQMKIGRTSYLQSARARDLLYPSLLIAVLFGAIYALIVSTALGDSLVASMGSPQNAFWIKGLFASTAGIMVAFGILGAMLLSRSYHRPSVLSSDSGSKGTAG